MTMKLSQELTEQPFYGPGEKITQKNHFRETLVENSADPIDEYSTMPHCQSNAKIGV